jgi:hypothetical protein
MKRVVFVEISLFYISSPTLLRNIQLKNTENLSVFFTLMSFMNILFSFLSQKLLNYISKEHTLNENNGHKFK